MRLILDFVKCKHFFYKTGWISITKIPAFVDEMHAKIGVGMTRHQRDYARKKGKSCGHLVLVKPFEEGKTNGFGKVFFCLLWSMGDGYQDVFPQYSDARKPYQRIHFETVKQTTTGLWETKKAYKLTQLEHRQHVAKNRRGEVLLDDDGKEIMTAGSRHLTWVISEEAFDEAKEMAKELAGRFLSSYRKLTPGAAEQIIKWSEFLQKRPGFYGINQQRYQLKCLIWSALRAADMRKDIKTEEAQLLINRIREALDASPPPNPGRFIAWSDINVADWLATAMIQREGILTISYRLIPTVKS